jgi:hypothetical protein
MVSVCTTGIGAAEFCVLPTLHKDLDFHAFSVI